MKEIEYKYPPRRLHTQITIYLGLESVKSIPKFVFLITFGQMV